MLVLQRSALECSRRDAWGMRAGIRRQESGFSRLRQGSGGQELARIEESGRRRVSGICGVDFHRGGSTKGVVPPLPLAISSAHKLTHSSQMHAVGLAINLRTSSWPLPQNEQRSDCGSLLELYSAEIFVRSIDAIIGDTQDQEPGIRESAWAGNRGCRLSPRSRTPSACLNPDS